MSTKRPVPATEPGQIHHRFSSRAPPHVNTWVQVKISNFWKHAAVGLVTEVSKEGVSVLLPNVFTLVHGFSGKSYRAVSGLAYSELRPYTDEKLPLLKHSLLQAIQENHHPSKDTLPLNLNCKELEVGIVDGPGDNDLPMTFEMLTETGVLGRVCEFLFTFVDSSHICRDQVDLQELLGKEWLYTNEMKRQCVECTISQRLQGYQDVQYGKHLAKSREPEMFRFLRTSKTIITNSILSMKLAQHEAIGNGKKLRLYAMMSGSIRNAFKPFWTSARRLRRLESSEAERHSAQAHVVAMWGAEQHRRKAERLKVLQSLAKDLRLEQHMPKCRWAVNDLGPVSSERKLYAITILISEAFSKTYGVDPNIVALTVQEVLAAQPKLAEQELRDALAVLHTRASIFTSGELIFLL